ncbi:MAG: hypothetical protein M3O82_05750, partial [Verrucomicrobiota bacterium]|nr:hypothetical protein [Verrucomicrobiota bacterium]
MNATNQGYGAKTRSRKERKRGVVFESGPLVKIYRSTSRKLLKSGAEREYETFALVYNVAGERKQRNFADLREAKAEARLVGEKIQHGEQAILELKSTDRASYLHAMDELAPMGLPLHAVVAEYVAAKKMLNGSGTLLEAAKRYAQVAIREKIKRGLVDEITAELLQDRKQDDASVRYLQSLLSHLGRFSESFQTDISSVTAEMIDAWLRKLGVAGRTRNNLRMSIVTLFHFARSKGYLQKGKATEADHVSRAKDRGGEIGIFTAAQLSKLLIGVKDDDGEVTEPSEASEEARLY